MKFVFVFIFSLLSFPICTGLNWI